MPCLPLSDPDRERYVWLESMVLRSRGWGVVRVGGDILACENSMEGWSGYLPSQGRSNIRFPLSPWVGKARRTALAQLRVQGQGGAAQ